MSWLHFLGLAVVITVVVALTGIKPKKTRHVSHTKLMGAARVTLVIVVIVLVALAWKSKTG